MHSDLSAPTLHPAPQPVSSQPVSCSLFTAFQKYPPLSSQCQLPSVSHGTACRQTATRWPCRAGVHGDPDSLQRPLPLPLGLLLVHLQPVLNYSPSPTAPCSLVTASTHTIRGRMSRLETTILPRGPTFSVSFSAIAYCGAERMFSLVNARREQV